jgi:hypothetical protein
MEMRRKNDYVCRRGTIKPKDLKLEETSGNNNQGRGPELQLVCHHELTEHTTIKVDNVCRLRPSAPDRSC